MIERRKDTGQIIRDFKIRQTRQYLAMGLALLLLLMLSLLYTRSDIFGSFSKDAVFASQAIVIAAFIGFSAVNWRCPSCGKYLGPNINKKGCKHCKTRLT